MNNEQSKYKNIAHTFHVKYANVHIKDITIAQLFDKIFYICTAVPDFQQL